MSIKTPVSNKTIWAFDLGKGSLLIPADFAENKKGAAKAPVQELRFTSGSSCDLRSQANRFLRTADPQVLIS
jgi:hypothetical protein